MQTSGIQYLVSQQTMANKRSSPSDPFAAVVQHTQPAVKYHKSGSATGEKMQFSIDPTSLLGVTTLGGVSPVVVINEGKKLPQPGSFSSNPTPVLSGHVSPTLNGGVNSNTTASSNSNVTKVSGYHSKAFDGNANLLCTPDNHVPVGRNARIDSQVHSLSAFPVSTIQVDTNMQNQVLSSGLCNQTVVSSIALDMSVTLTERGKRSLLKDKIREKVFRFVKFYNRDRHGYYSNSPKSVSGMLFRYSHMNHLADEQLQKHWFHDVRKIVVKTISDHRNNCIKAMKLRFRGTYKYPLIVVIVVMTHV